MDRSDVSAKLLLCASVFLLSAILVLTQVSAVEAQSCSVSQSGAIRRVQESLTRVRYDECRCRRTGFTQVCEWSFLRIETIPAPSPPTPIPLPPSTPTRIPTSTPTPTHTPQTAIRPDPTAEPTWQAVTITDFEEFGTWRRGNESWGTFTQSRDLARSGSYSGRIEYNFPAVDNNHLVFQRILSIAGRPDALSIYVAGDGSTNFLNAWITDANGSAWQVTFGRIDHTGWQRMIAPLDLGAGWPNGHISGPNSGSIRYPIQLSALVLDGYTSDRSFSGTVYFDDLEALYAEGAPVAESANLVPSTSTNQIIATIVSDGRLNVRSGPGTSYRIVTQVRNGERYVVLDQDRTTGWVKIAVSSAPGGSGWVSNNYVTLSR